MSNLTAYALQRELSNHYDEMEHCLEEYIDLLIEADCLGEDDEIDVYDNEWLTQAVMYLTEQTLDDEIGSLNDEIQILIELRDSIGEELWDNGIHLIHADNVKDLAEEFVINHVVINCYALDLIREHVDFVAIGDDVLNDYSSVEFRGETYYYKEN